MGRLVARLWRGLPQDTAGAGSGGSQPATESCPRLDTPGRRGRAGGCQLPPKAVVPLREEAGSWPCLLYTSPSPRD
eukprot:2039493-Alexandrium_andersonii.AAC.1